MRKTKPMKKQLGRGGYGPYRMISSKNVTFMHRCAGMSTAEIIRIQPVSKSKY